MANLYRDADVTTARPKAQAPLGARLEVVKPAEDPQKRWITRAAAERRDGLRAVG